MEDSPLSVVRDKKDSSMGVGFKTLANGETKAFTKSLFAIETSSNDSYCYPAIFETNDGVLISYYHSNNTPVCLNSTKITKVTFDEIKNL